MADRWEAVRQLLRRGRRDRIYSAAACEVGTSADALVNEVVGTVSWDGPPVSRDAPFDIASVTKPIVGLLAMSLVENGTLALDDTVSDLLPKYRGSDKQDLTLHQVLTHTSGIPGQVPLFRSAPTEQQMLAALTHLPLVSRPGSTVAYTSQGFMILGQVLAEAARQPLDEALTDHVLRPMAMHNTGFGLPESCRSQAVATEECPWRGRLVQGTVHDENAHVLGGCAGHAGLFSTTGDLGRMCRTMLRGGAGENARVLSEPAVRHMTTGHTDHLELRRGIAWQGRDATSCPAGDLVGQRSFGHTGFTGTSVWIDPDLDVYVVLLTNSVHPRRNPARIATFRRRFHNLVIASIARSSK